MRVKLVVAYDGTNYCGWQIQPNGITIEEVLNESLSGFFGTKVKVSGASRTDAGVHSLGNIAWFDVETRMPAEKIAFAVNRSLPDDIRIRSSARVPDNWNPHLVNSVKTYEYRILSSRQIFPTERLYADCIPWDLDWEKMNRAGQALIGEHDFTSYASPHAQVTSFVREITDLEVTGHPFVPEGRRIVLTVRGKGFLYQMVRIIAGTLIEIGRGHLPESAAKEILMARDRGKAGPTAPAHGLTMISWEEIPAGTSDLLSKIPDGEPQKKV